MVVAIADHQASALLIAIARELGERVGVCFAAPGRHDCCAGPQTPAQGAATAVVPVVRSCEGARPRAGGVRG
jgi:hypothetical protein